MRTFSLLLCALAGQSPPADVPRRHVEEIEAPSAEYRIVQGGTMDGENCRSPLGGGFGIWTQTWESNREVRLENVGETDVVDPWLSNGRNDFRTMREIAEGAVRPGMTDRERAMAIWRRQTTHRFHAGADDAAEMHDPVKVFNVYGYTTCGDDSVCLAGLWHAAGLPVSPGRLLGHRTSQVYFDGRWNLLDGDLGPVYLLRDNATIASEFDLVRDHDLVKRSHPYGMLDPDRRSDRELHAAAFVSEKEPAADRAIADIVRSSTMSLTLRPGEALVWRWGAGGSPKYHGNAEIRTWGPRTAGGRTWGASAADRICNGRWEYRPDFGREGWRKGAERVENVVVERGGLASGTVVWRMRSPYVFVGGRVESAGGARLFLSWDGVDWKPVGESLDPFFPSRGPARYEYRLKCDVPAGARLDRLAVLNDVQMAPLALPGMVLGENRFAYTDRTPGPRKVRLTHEWVERSLHRPPGAPTVPRVSQEGGLRFEWRAPEGEAAADYHFELSDRADFAWPLSSNFEKLIGNTADRGSARYRVPSGLLAPGRTYLWRVRAQSAAGVWGPWSEAWTFTAGGPATPTEVRLEGRILRWKGGAARYRVYGSDERGFSASDEPYDVEVGRSKEVPSRALSNFIAETAETELVVLGTANKAFYRVVAVDERGNRSGPSDYASAPRPFFTREPSPSAKVGVAYRDQVSVIRSLGDLRLQWVDEAEVPGFWDVERPRFAIGKGPAWLRIDPRTGALEGVPDAAGTFDVEVVATLERTVRRLRDPGPRPWNLGLGKDPTDALVAEKAGEATHRFRIVVE